MRRTYMPIFTIALFLVSACDNQDSGQTSPSSANEVKKELRESTGAMEPLTKHEKARFQQSFEAQLNNLDRKQEELEVKFRQAEQRTQAKMPQVIQTMNSHKEELKIRVQKLGLATDEVWRQMKESTQTALENLEEEYNWALEKF